MEQKKDFEEARDTFLKLLPIIPALFTLVGSAKIYFQYKKYNVNIFEYIELSEILILFLSDIFLYLFPAGAISVLNTFDSEFDYKFLDYKIQKISLGSFLKWFLIQFPVLIGILAFLMMLRSGIITQIHNKYLLILLELLIIQALFIVMVKIYKNVMKYVKDDHSPTVVTVYRFYLLTIILAFSTTLVYTFNYYNSKDPSTNYSGTYIKTDKQIYNINKEILLIGRTKNYIFVYSAVDKCTEIIPVNQILEYNLITQ